ncbi:MAG: 4Fe-4S single cluster domain-containing protein [Alphaproteobacteria bacterium]
MLPQSSVNGPGERFTIWAQGCHAACVGCWNPDTWSFATKKLVQVEKLAEEILNTKDIEGVTFTGGEPFEQAAAFAALARLLRSFGLSIFVFSGYELEDLQAADHQLLLAVTDLLVTGRYVKAQKDELHPWRGSTNQQIHFLTDRYQLSDVPEENAFEVYIHPNGQLVMTGFPEEEIDE